MNKVYLKKKKKITELKKNLNFFAKQIGMCEKFQTAWKETGKNMKVQLPMKCTQQIWIGGGHGTFLHKDVSNFSLSFCQYLGFNWGKSNCGVGLPELRILWKNSPEFVMAICVCHYFHMSLPLDLELKMMVCLLLIIKKIKSSEKLNKRKATHKPKPLKKLVEVKLIKNL